MEYNNSEDGFESGFIAQSIPETVATETALAETTTIGKAGDGC
jgi:hypothetical protein